MRSHLHAHDGRLLPADDRRREGHHVRVDIPRADRLPTGARHQPAAAVVAQSPAVRQVPHLHRHRRRLQHPQLDRLSQLELAHAAHALPVAGSQDLLLQVPRHVPHDETARRRRPTTTTRSHPSLVLDAPVT